LSDRCINDEGKEVLEMDVIALPSRSSNFNAGGKTTLESVEILVAAAPALVSLRTCKLDRAVGKVAGSAVIALLDRSKVFNFTKFVEG